MVWRRILKVKLLNMILKIKFKKIKVAYGLISPTYKRTEGRALVWGSEFTSKDAKLQGGSSRNRCYAERKIVGFGDCAVTRGGELPLLSPILFSNLFDPSRTITDLAQRN
jgi:hypothetical protein